MELTAISGEFPTILLDRLTGGKSYKQAMIYKLKKQGWLRTYYKDRLRTYRLTMYAKQQLLAECPERFAFYLTGNADTNLLKSEITRRLRLCRIASAYITMLDAEVLVFRDHKPDVFRHNGEIVPDKTAQPAFYSSREIKGIGAEAVKIHNTRLVGLLLTNSQVFVTYNNIVNAAKWDYRAEMRAKVLIKNSFCRQGNNGGYSSDSICGLLLEDGMEPLYQLLTEADSGKRGFFLRDGCYEHFYYLTNDRFGAAIVKLLCCAAETEKLHDLLMKGLAARKPGWLFEHDAIDGEGKPVLFGYSCDMPRMLRFANALQLHDRQGILICFDFQAEILGRCFGEHLVLQIISFDKFERRDYT